MNSRWPRWAMPACVLLAACLAQLPLILNPGYFSHDELQWASFADQAPGWYLRGYLWSSVQAFQYRPLTFSLWLWLSQHLFAHPQAFHAAMVVAGSLNAAMLAMLLRRFGIAGGIAAIAALAFALGPYAIYTHGWVATLADLIWTGCALLIALIAQRNPRPAVCIAATCSLTALALLAKEAAIVIPALLGLAWLFLGRRRNWAIATFAALLPVAVYLALRIGVLLFSPRVAENYGWSLAFIPQRWLEYLLFIPIPTKMEVAATLAHGLNARVVLAALLWLVLGVSLWRGGRRWLLALLLAGFAALGPVLILAQSANQYGYGFAAMITAICAAAWPRMNRIGRVAMSMLLLLSLWHGVNVMRGMRHAGELQSRFSPALAEAVAKGEGATVRLRVADESDRWIYVRLTHEIPSYRGVAIGDRVRLANTGETADYTIESDGRLTPLR